MFFLRHYALPLIQWQKTDTPKQVACTLICVSPQVNICTHVHQSKIDTVRYSNDLTTLFSRMFHITESIFLDFYISKPINTDMVHTFISIRTHHKIIWRYFAFGPAAALTTKKTTTSHKAKQFLITSNVPLYVMSLES